MNRKAKGMTGAAFLAIALIGAGCSTKPQVISQAKEFDPVTAPLCEVRNETKQKILLKVVDEPPTPPTTGGSYTIYPQGEKFDTASIYCHSKVEVYFQASTKPIETVVIDKPGVIHMKRQKPGFLKTTST
jgi:hypothetical protein